MKIYYIENISAKDIEQIYFIEDEFGVCFSFCASSEQEPFEFEFHSDSLADYKSHWKQDFSLNAICVRVV